MSTSVDERQAAAQTLARDIALAMNDAAIRAHVRNAMRESRVTDHKLILQDFVRTRHGADFVRAIAAASGTTDDAVLARIDRLPAMDFYVPFQSHRLAWKGSPDLLVAASFQPDAPELSSFALDGSVQTLRLSDGSPARTLLILHPAEPTNVRPPNGQVDDGETIQSPDDDGVIIMAYPPPPDDGGGGGSSVPPGLYVTQFYSPRGDGWWGSLEMEFRSRGFEGYPTYQGGVWYSTAWCNKYTGVATLEPERNYTNLLIAVGPGITSVAAVRCNNESYPYGYEMELFESDGGLNGPGDDFGRRFFVGVGLPFGATVGQQQSYYSQGGTPQNGEHSANMTWQYR